MPFADPARVRRWNPFFSVSLNPSLRGDVYEENLDYLSALNFSLEYAGDERRAQW
jgi:hypothetical protein